MAFSISKGTSHHIIFIHYQVQKFQGEILWNKQALTTIVFHGNEYVERVIQAAKVEGYKAFNK